MSITAIRCRDGRTKRECPRTTVIGFLGVLQRLLAWRSEAADEIS
jgi:hypothetical protein